MCEELAEPEAAPFFTQSSVGTWVALLPEDSVHGNEHIMGLDAAASPTTKVLHEVWLQTLTLALTLTLILTLTLTLTMEFPSLSLMEFPSLSLMEFPSPSLGVIHQVLIPTLHDSRSSLFLGKLQIQLDSRGVQPPNFELAEVVIASGGMKNYRETQDESKDTCDSKYVKYPNATAEYECTVTHRMNQAAFEMSNEKHTIFTPHGTCILFDEHVPHGGYDGLGTDVVFEYKVTWSMRKAAQFIKETAANVEILARKHGWTISDGKVVSALCYLHVT